jgi:hypothetical protein
MTKFWIHGTVLWVTWVQGVLTQCSPYTCSWNTKMCRKYSRASSRATLFHFKNILLFLHVLTCSFRWNMSTGKSTTFTQHYTNRNSARRKPSTVLFNSNSGNTIAEAITVNSHNGQLTLRTDSHASDSGAVWRERKTILGPKSKLLYSEIALSRKPFGIGHMYIYNFLLTMADTMTSQNIGFSS